MNPGGLVTRSPVFCLLTDTGATAVLALTCVRSNKTQEMEASTEDQVKNYTATLANKIQSEGEQGLFGNIFSTGEAMQVSQKAKR